MDATDVETYARRCAEDELRLPSDNHGDETGTLVERLRALVFTDLLADDVAARILAGHERARQLRGLSGGQHDWTPEPAGPPARICTCSGEVEFEGVTLTPELVVFRGDGSVRIQAGARADAPRRPARYGHTPMPFETTEIRVADDTGTVVDMHISHGGGGGSDWHGWFETHQPLSPTTAWLKIDGTRVALNDAVSGSSVSVAPRTDGPPATRYLEHLDRTQVVRHRDTPLRVAAEALRACGALPPGDPQPQLAQPGIAPGGPPMHGRRGQRNNTTRIAVGVTAALSDMVTVTVLSLSVSRRGFDVAVQGGGAVELGFHGSSRLDTPRLAFGGVDDVGTAYQGELGGWGGGSEGFHGTVTYAPPLDPRARELRLYIDTERVRAVVTVPLPGRAS